MHLHLSVHCHNWSVHLWGNWLVMSVGDHQIWSQTKWCMHRHIVHIITAVSSTTNKWISQNYPFHWESQSWQIYITKICVIVNFNLCVKCFISVMGFCAVLLSMLRYLPPQISSRPSPISPSLLISLLFINIASIFVVNCCL